MVNSAGIGAVTSPMVNARAGELAEIDGRPPKSPSDADIGEARQELTGDVINDPKEAAIESAADADRWNPVPGSTSVTTLVADNADEDSEGRSDCERLVEEGVSEAEHDIRLQAARAARRSPGA